MAEDGSVAVAVADVETDAADEEQPKRRLFGLLGGGKSEDEEPEHEIEFSTPFGKLELEFEPTTSKEKRDKKRREEAERNAAKKAAEQAAKAKRESESKKQLALEAAATKQGGGLGKLVGILVIIGVIAGAIAIAYWLFGRKPEELEEVPPEYRSADAAAIVVEAEPAGFVPKMRERFKRAVRAGQQASAEAQKEQQARYEDLTRGG